MVVPSVKINANFGTPIECAKVKCIRRRTVKGDMTCFVMQRWMRSVRTDPLRNSKSGFGMGFKFEE